MRYWDDMQSKYGFSDGGAVPDGAEIYRTVYIRAVNKLAEQLNSTVRAVAYDRAGLHNWCLILFYDVKDLTGYIQDDLAQSLNLSAAEVIDPDELMDEAIGQAHLIDLDDFVQVSVDLSDDFDNFLTALYPVNEDDPLVADVNGQPQHIYPGGRVQLVREIEALNGTLLAIESNYTVMWIDHHPPLVGLAVQTGENVCATTSPDAVIVIEIPAAIRTESKNSAPVPPFHLRDLEDEPLDKHGEVYDWDAAQAMMRCAARELGKCIQLINGYGNPIMSCDPTEESE